MPSNIGAQLVKTLSFEVEAIPQDNAAELKKTTNMTPLNVKVRVRKKDDGSSLMRKGILSVPRNNQPDKPIEKLRLASSDQTIMSFDMVLEADLETKAARKPKKHFFGICLGAQEDDDDAQYLPSTTSIDYDSRSDTGVTKLRNVRVVKPVTDDDVISSNSSRKKDKIFGKCKPGGCLDPPFGEDKYAYQPQPLRFKAPATTIDNAQAIDLQNQTSDKISVNKKDNDELASEKVADEQNQDKPILNLYQGESGADIKENDSESIITYPTGISSSGILLADGKNVARRTSGARNSRKSFNEFSSNEYFSPPRASKDSSKSDKEKNLLSPRDNKAVSPTRFRHSVEKSGSKDLELFGTDNTSQGLKDKNHDGNNKVGIGDMTKDSIVQKPALRTTSEGLISELFSDLENDSDRKTWTETAAAAGIAAATTAGLVGIGLAANAKKEIAKPEDHKENPLTEDIQLKDVNNQRSDLGLNLLEGTSDDIKTDKSIPLEITPEDNSVNQGAMVGSKNINNISENQGQMTPMRSQLQDSDHSFRGLETTRDSEKNASQTEKSIGQNNGGQLASTGMEIIGDSQRNFSPLRHQMHDDMDEHRVPTEVYGDPTSGKTELKDNTIRSSEIDTTFKKDFPTVQGTENNGENIELIADTASKGIGGTLGPESGLQNTEKLTHSGILEDFASSGMTIEVGSDTGYSQKNGEIYKGSKDELAGTYDEALSLRRVMSEGMERGRESKTEIMNSGSEGALKSPPTVKSSNEIGTNQRPLPDLTPDELRLSEGTHGIRHAADETREESIFSKAADRKISGDFDIDLLSHNQGLDEGRNYESTNDGVDSFERHIPLKGTKRTNDEQVTSWPAKSDASVVTDIINSPSDIILKYRENKTLNQSPVIGVDIQPTENTLEQAGRKLDDLGTWGSKGNKEGQFSSSVRVSPHDTGSKYSKNSATDEYYGKTDKTGSSHSRESVFLNLAFQTYLDENQRTVKTLDSSQDQDSDNVVFVKSLLRAQDKKGVTVPLDSKNVMNIVIKPTSPAQSHKSRPAKSISKFDSGKSDYSNSTVSLKNIGSDPNAALSAILHHELVPLQSLIKSLKDEIDSLASQQMMLSNRLEVGTSRSKSFVAKKCGCPKKYFKY